MYCYFCEKFMEFLDRREEIAQLERKLDCSKFKFVG